MGYAQKTVTDVQATERAHPDWCRVVQLWVAGGRKSKVNAFVRIQLGVAFAYDATQSCSFVAVRLAFNASGLPSLEKSKILKFVEDGRLRKQQYGAGLTRARLVAFVNPQHADTWEVCRASIKANLFTGSEIGHAGVLKMTAGGGVLLLGAEGQGFMCHCVTIERRNDNVLVGDDCG